MQYPKHVALIPDWNRTWARERWKMWIEWHLEWLKRCEELATYVFENTDIDVFTSLSFAAPIATPSAANFS